ncbi:hypothetical protein ACPPVO_10750 [Dactylosporangium sp. McL0621]
MKAGATGERRELAELTGAPVTTTLMALGAFALGLRPDFAGQADD